MTRQVEDQIERLFTALEQHHFGATDRDKPFCSCGWFGNPSTSLLSAERQFSRHQATALVIHHHVVIR